MWYDSKLTVRSPKLTIIPRFVTGSGLVSSPAVISLLVPLHDNVIEVGCWAATGTNGSATSTAT
jgi:hypothetical protein